MTSNEDAKESDAKGATESEIRKISSIDPRDAFGNEHASEEHTGQPEESIDEED